MTYHFSQVYLEKKFVAGSTKEEEGPLGNLIDEIIYPSKTDFEDLEMELVQNVYRQFIKEKPELVLFSDLSDQLAIGYHVYSNIEVPALGVYAACASFNLDLILAAIMIENHTHQRILCTASSYTETAERQFRNPIEYGGSKEDTQTTTASLCVGALLSSNPNLIRITEATVGNVIDVDYKNVMNFGALMAPSAIEVLLTHFHNTNTKPWDYDLILSGDLGKYGHQLVFKALKEEYHEEFNYQDAGCILYDSKIQEVFEGASGPASIGSVALSYIYLLFQKKLIHKVLLCATGALMNSDFALQKRTIPSVSHIVVLEA